MKSQIEESMLGERLIAALSACFGLLALVLAVVGLYGVVSYIVARRQSEIGIRLALGATPVGITSMVVRDMAAWIVLGLSCGVGAALAWSSGARNLVFGLQPNDPFVLATTAGLLLFAGIVAALVPARRAAATDPAYALRQPGE